jgi:acetylornithine deacetylase/succinyl-diaminopimelate desuccinylase-like protein
VKLQRPMSEEMATASALYNPVEILQKLIRFDTSNPPGNERECVAFIDQLLAQVGIKTRLLAKSDARPNLIARIAGQGNAPPILIYGHVDVVPANGQRWQHPPFSGVLTEGYVWGRGALDMKGGVAMILSAVLRAKAERVQLPGDVVLAIVCDEERLGDYGAGFLVKSHPELFSGIRYALGEFGGFSLSIGKRRFYPIQVAEKQICWVRVCFSGPGGHGSMPVRGGAMAKLAHFLHRLDSRSLPLHVTPPARLMFETMASALGGLSGLAMRQLVNPALSGSMLRLLGQRQRLFAPLVRNTASPTMLGGSSNLNVIPDEVTVDLDGRLLPGFGPDDLIRELRTVGGDEGQFEVVRFEPGPSGVDMGLFGILADILKEADVEAVPCPLLLSGITDGRFFSRLGIQTYGFLPMSLPEEFNFMETVHATDERIPVDALEFGTRAIYQALQRFSG